MVRVASTGFGRLVSNSKSIPCWDPGGRVYRSFFPQGTLINLLEPQAVGITDTSALKSDTPAEWLYPRYRVIAKVFEYDEVNQWVHLTRAEVMGRQY